MVGIFWVSFIADAWYDVICQHILFYSIHVLRPETVEACWVETPSELNELRAPGFDLMTPWNLAVA